MKPEETVDLLGVQVTAKFKEWHDENCHDCGGNCILLSRNHVEDWMERSENCPAEEKS